jgi:hypothetical protein
MQYQAAVDVEIKRPGAGDRADMAVAADGVMAEVEGLVGLCVKQIVSGQHCAAQDQGASWLALDD